MNMHSTRVVLLRCLHSLNAHTNRSSAKDEFGHQLNSALSITLIGISVFLIAGLMTLGAVYVLGSIMLEAAVCNAM